MSTIETMVQFVLLKYKGLFFIYLISKPENEKSAQAKLIEELEKIQNGEFEELNLEKAKNQIKTSYHSLCSIVAIMVRWPFTPLKCNFVQPILTNKSVRIS